MCCGGQWASLQIHLPREEGRRKLWEKSPEKTFLPSGPLGDWSRCIETQTPISGFPVCGLLTLNWPVFPKDKGALVERTHWPLQWTKG